MLRPAPAPLELARALIDLGAAQRRAGARTTARELLREGLDLAHAMGGLALRDRARRELVIAGGRPRRDAARGRDALTPGELRVAQLAAAGHTNRQIAQALFVTQRTVENHLTSTYAKLQISSRSGLPPPSAAAAQPEPSHRRCSSARGLPLYRPWAAALPAARAEQRAAWPLRWLTGGYSVTGPVALITWWKATGGLVFEHVPPERAPIARMLSW